MYLITSQQAYLIIMQCLYNFTKNIIYYRSQSISSPELCLSGAMYHRSCLTTFLIYLCKNASVSHINSHIEGFFVYALQSYCDLVLDCIEIVIPYSQNYLFKSLCEIDSGGIFSSSFSS